MDEKRFGVKTHLVQQLRRFQLSLKHRRKTMVFQTNAYVTVNGGRVRKLVQAFDGKMSIIPSPYAKAFRPPRQILEHIDAIRIKVEMDVEHFAIIEFDCEEHKTSFVANLGDLNVSSDEETQL